MKIFARALNSGVTLYREVAGGFLNRSVIIVKKDNGFKVSTWARHTDRPMKYEFATQKEVSQFTADYFGF